MYFKSTNHIQSCNYVCGRARCCFCVFALDLRDVGASFVSILMPIFPFFHNFAIFLLSLVWLQTELDSTQSYYHYLSIKTPWRIMAWSMNQFPYSCLNSLYKHHFCFLSTETGRTSSTRNSIPSKFRATVQSWIRGLAGSLRLNSPFIWPSVRTQFSLMILMGSCWWFLPGTASFRRKLARCFGLSLTCTPFSNVSSDDSSLCRTIYS